MGKKLTNRFWATRVHSKTCEAVNGLMSHKFERVLPENTTTVLVAPLTDATILDPLEVFAVSIQAGFPQL